MSQGQKTLAVHIPIVKCPYCGISDLDAEGRAFLISQHSRRIGNVRERPYLCRACGRKFMARFALQWTNGNAEATGVIIEEG